MDHCWTPKSLRKVQYVILAFYTEHWLRTYGLVHSLKLIEIQVMI